VEVDASSIGGMLKNPDTIPGAPMNRWVKAILQFTFKLVHTPAHKHKAPDALSRRRQASDEEDLSQESDPEE
jgi:hypothetical protein